MPALALLALVLVAGAASSAVLYNTSFELPKIPAGATAIHVDNDGAEWKYTPFHPWGGEGNQIMWLRGVDVANDPNFRNPVRARTGVQSAYQHEISAVNSAMHDFGQDLYENFYVKAWVWLEPVRERVANGAPCEAVDYFVTSGTITSADDGGVPIPGWESYTCRKSDPHIADEHNFFHTMYSGSCSQTSPTGGGTSCPVGPYLEMTSGAAVGKRWDIYRPTFYTCGGAPYTYNPSWDTDPNPGKVVLDHHKLHLVPQADDPNPQPPYAAGVRPGDTYIIRGSVNPLYRNIQMWVENRGEPIDMDPLYRWQNQKDFAKFGILHRRDDDGGYQCSDTNNWSFLTRKSGNAGLNDYYYGDWTDTGVLRDVQTAGWHSIQISVFSDRFDFLLDDVVVGTAPRYTDEGPVAFNRVQIGGLHASQEPAFWDDIEIGTLPGGLEIEALPTVQAARNEDDGAWVSLPAGVVDMVGEGWFHVQGQDFTGGIRCAMPEVYSNGGALINSVSKGDLVSLTGKIATVNGCEKILMPLNPNVLAHNQPFSAPLFATHRSLAGPPSTSGLSVTTTGWVVDDGDWMTYFYIKDANDMFGVQVFDPKIKVYGQTPGPYNFVIVKGIAACENGEPVIHTGGAEDGIISVWP